jgi:hypothetical protein
VRKIAAFIFILSANIILLAHAVIPHHHHDHDKSTVEPGHQHEIPHHGHERQGEQTDQAFILDEEIVLRLTQGRYFVEITELQDNHSLQFQSALLVGLYGLVEYLPVLNSDASIPLMASSYICFTESSCGLRAPPSI